MTEPIHRFRVGVTTLRSSGGGDLLYLFGFNHCCLLLDDDVFEYGADESRSYERRRGVGRDVRYDWFQLGDYLNGTTKVSPDALERTIRNSGEWGPGHFDFEEHNCYDFVQFCLRAIGCPESMIINNDPCYQRHKCGLS